MLIAFVRGRFEPHQTTALCAASARLHDPNRLPEGKCIDSCRYILGRWHYIDNLRYILATEETTVTQTSLPVAIIGAGPIGLVAAAHLLSRGERPIILEASASVD